MKLNYQNKMQIMAQYAKNKKYARLSHQLIRKIKIEKMMKEFINTSKAELNHKGIRVKDSKKNSNQRRNINNIFKRNKKHIMKIRMKDSNINNKR